MPLADERTRMIGTSQMHVKEGLVETGAIRRFFPRPSALPEGAVTTSLPSPQGIRGHRSQFAT
jgi:hypothetical protein